MVVLDILLPVSTTPSADRQTNDADALFMYSTWHVRSFGVFQSVLVSGWCAVCFLAFDSDTFSNILLLEQSIVDIYEAGYKESRSNHGWLWMMTTNGTFQSQSVKGLL